MNRTFLVTVKRGSLQQVRAQPGRIQRLSRGLAQPYRSPNLHGGPCPPDLSNTLGRPGLRLHLRRSDLMAANSTG